MVDSATTKPAKPPTLHALHLTADEAAAILGVSIASLYAYVGRKGIRSQAVPGSRARVYWRDDVERVAEGKGGQTRVKWDSILVPETKITLLTEEGQFYRGVSAIALSEHASLEAVAGLLWEQDEPDLFSSTLPSAPEGFVTAWKALSSMAPVDRAAAMFPLIESANTRGHDRSAGGYARTSAELLRWLAAMMIGEPKPSAQPIHLVMARAFEADDVYADLIRRLLVLFADHELSATTYAVRAVANTGCTPYEAVAAGLLASKGHRIAEGRGPTIARFLKEIAGDADPTQPVLERLKAGEPLPGFSHGLYKGGDARARSILKVMRRHPAPDEETRRLFSVIELAHDRAGIEPDIALLSVFIERKLKHRAAIGTIQLVARSVGWMAHAYEQMASVPLVRPRTAYTGSLPRTG